MTYGNGTTVSYIYDALDRLEKISYNSIDNVRYEYQYTSDGKLHTVTDYLNNKGYLYEYDSADRVSGYTEYELDKLTNTLSVSYDYNKLNQVSSITTQLDYLKGTTKNTVSWIEDFEYDSSTTLLTRLVLSSGATHATYSPSKLTINYNYDNIDRLTKKNIALNGYGSFSNTVLLSYNDTSDTLSSEILQYSSQVGSAIATTYTYTYDDNGNITQIVDNNNKITKYYYDDLGQLIREDNPYLNKSYTYTYDDNGNRISKQTYTYATGNLSSATETVSYTYGDSTWGDRLTKYNNTTLSFDAIGNPLNYYNGNSAYKFTWKDGRRLATARKGSVDYSFNYNDEGIRTSKTVGGVEHTYILDGSRIVSEQWGNYFIVYLYDESGTPIGMQYRTSSMAEDVFETYYFEKNLQGDIIAVYNASGLKVVGYTYDAWGNCTTTYYNSGSSTGAQYNPFRYRGYYYDSDFGFYYLNNRYYDPKTGRFINSDSVLNGGVGLTSYNLFAYCSNNPIKFSDPSGNYAKDFKMTTLAPGTPTYMHGRPVYYEEKIPFLVFIKQVFDDCDNFNFWNKNPDAVFDSNYFSCYKGKLVILHSSKFLSSWGIFNTIFLNRNVDKASTIDKTNTINHEYGHLLQEEKYGVGLYLIGIALPSMIYNLASKNNQNLKNMYYSMPWEYNADVLGGVNRGDYQPWAEQFSNYYFEIYNGG